MKIRPMVIYDAIIGNNIPSVICFSIVVPVTVG